MNLQSTAIDYEEPSLEYVVPDEEVRSIVFPTFLQAALLVGQRYGQIETTGNQDGIAVWIGPEYNMSFRGTMQAALPLEYRERYSKLAETIELARAHLAGSPHWYLMLLAVDASLSEKAIADRLIAPVLWRASSTGTPCYLETFSANRLSLYRDYGFRITGAGRIPDGGPNFWTMVRTIPVPSLPSDCRL